jgi:polyhydroxyalkanoate synthase
VVGPPIARIGSTPKDVVWQRDKVQLWRYRSESIRHALPVVFFIGLVSRSYVLDLYPGNSVVARFRDAGFDVFLLDWGIPDELEAEHRLTTYVEEYLPRGLRAAREAAGVSQLSVIGYCMGALFALMLLGTRRYPAARNLVLMAPPIDFDHIPALSGLVKRVLDPDDLIDPQSGLVPSGLIRNAFRARKPTSEVVQYANLWQNLWSDEFLEGHQAMARWVSDHIPMPGPVLREFVDLLRTNAFITGTARLGSRPVVLENVRIPTLTVVAERDDLVPIESSLPLRDLIGSSDYEELRVPAGHIGLVMGRKGNRVSIPGIIDWLSRHGSAEQ